MILFLPVSWIKSKEKLNTRLLTYVYSYMWRYHLPADVNFHLKLGQLAKKAKVNWTAEKEKPARVFLQPISMWNTIEWRDDINKTTGSSTTPWPIFRCHVSFQGCNQSFDWWSCSMLYPDEISSFGSYQKWSFVCWLSWWALTCSRHFLYQTSLLQVFYWGRNEIYPTCLH